MGRWRLKHLLMAQLSVSLLTVIGMTAWECAGERRWWKMVVLNGCLLGAAVLAHLWTSLTTVKQESKLQVHSVVSDSVNPD